MKTPATKSDNLILIPGTHTVEERIDFTRCPGPPVYALPPPFASKEVDVGELSYLSEVM